MTRLIFITLIAGCVMLLSACSSLSLNGGSEGGENTTSSVPESYSMDSTN